MWVVYLWYYSFPMLQLFVLYLQTLFPCEVVTRPQSFLGGRQVDWKRNQSYRIENKHGEARFFIMKATIELRRFLEAHFSSSTMKRPYKYKESAHFVGIKASGDFTRLSILCLTYKIVYKISKQPRTLLIFIYLFIYL